MASVDKRPDGRWRARYRDPQGKQRSKHFDRKGEAEQWLRGAVVEMDRGTYRDREAGKEPFGAYAARWLSISPHRPSTHELYSRMINKHLLPTLGHRPLESIRRPDIQALVHELYGRLAPRSVANVHKLVRAIFNCAVEDGVLAQSPCRKIRLQTYERNDVVPLTLPDVQALVDALPHQYRALALLAVGTGLRQGEALGLRAQDIDFLRRTVRVDHQLVSVPGVPYQLGPPKTTSSRRTVPAPDFALAALSEHMQTYPAGPFGVLFTNTRGNVVARSSLHRSWVEAAGKAGLPPGTSFHDLRHTYASLLIEGGESVRVVAARLGHKTSNETLRTYAHLWPDNDSKTRGVVQAAFADLALDTTVVPISRSESGGRT